MKPHDPIDDLLKLPRPKSAVPAGGELCGDAELLAAYAERALDEPSRERFQLHLADCAPCRDAVVQLVRLTPRTGVSGAVPDGWWQSVSRGWRWAATAAATMILVGTFVVTRWETGGPVAETKVARAEEAQRGTVPVAPSAGSAGSSAAGSSAAGSSVVARAAQPAARKSKPAATDSVSSRAGAKDEATDIAADRPLMAAAAPPPAPAVALPQPAIMAKAQGGGGGRGGSGNATGNATGAAGAPAVVGGALRKEDAPQAMASSTSIAPQAIAPQSMGRNFADRDAASADAVRAEAGVTCSIVKGALSVIVGGGFPAAMKTPVGEEITTCKFVDALSGDVHSKSGRDFHTKDGGKTWTLVPPPAPKDQ